MRPPLRLFLLLALAACSPSTRALQGDLRQYLVHVREWAPTEAETARTIDRIFATQFVDDAEVRRQVTSDAPRVAAQIARMRAVTPLTSEVRAVHGRYLDAWIRLADGYAALLDGIDRGDAARVAAGRRALDAWRETIVTTASELKRLADSAGVTLDASAG